MVGIRLLMSSLLVATWIGTLGAVAITFVAFYVALRYTPLARYSKAVNSALQNWYSKKFIFPALIFSMIILSGLVAIVEFGYAYHNEQLISIDDFDSIKSVYSARNQFSSSLRALLAQGYSGFDALSVLLASVDKSLDGYYLRAVSFILAEDIEILAFLALIRRYGRNIFGSIPTSELERK